MLLTQADMFYQMLLIWLVNVCPVPSSQGCVLLLPQSCRRVCRNFSVMSCVYFSDKLASQRLYVGVANIVILVCRELLLLVVAFFPCRFTSRCLSLLWFLISLLCSSGFMRAFAYTADPWHWYQFLFYQNTAKLSWFSFELPSLFVSFKFFFSTCWSVQQGGGATACSAGLLHNMERQQLPQDSTGCVGMRSGCIACLLRAQLSINTHRLCF